MSLTVPLQPPGPAQTDGGGAGDEPPGRPPTFAVGHVELRSAMTYLLAWTGVVFAVVTLALWSAYEVLQRLGVLRSVSKAVATVLGDEVPASGVLPALELDALLPWLLASAGGLALLWLLTLLAVVLVHNGICALTGGPRVRVR